MTQILSEDYVNKRIYLHPDTVVFGIDPAELQREHRARRRINASGERRFAPMVSFSGYEQVGPTTYTPRLTNLASGVRFVPYDTAHKLKIKNQIVCISDGFSNQDCADRISVLSNVDIDVDYDKIEIVKVSTGSGVSPQDIIDIASLSRELLLNTTEWPV